MKYTYRDRYIAHRGGGALAPENTLVALREGHARGFTAVEFDVMLSRDDVPLLMHDDNFLRTTQLKAEVGQVDFADARNLDAGAWHSARFAGESVPGLIDAGELCIELGLVANIEIKPWAPGGVQVAANTGRTVSLAAERLWAGQAWQPLLSSFSEDALAAALYAAPSLPRALLFDRVPDDWKARLETLKCAALHCNGKWLDADTARAIKEAGYALMCYTINKTKLADKLFAMGVDAICTDRLDLWNLNTEITS
jgi:glycerophosphoryl diester phosphodiesterase